ncbi:hypothetical protein ACWIGI_24645 [Nocardia sp. NPDC055321]
MGSTVEVRPAPGPFVAVGDAAGTAGGYETTAARADCVETRAVDSLSRVGRISTGVRACVVSVCCALLLVGCGNQSGPEPGPLAGGAPAPGGVTFDADVVVTGTDIAVTWRVVNRSGNELVFPTPFSDRSATPAAESYVVPAGDDIEIAQRFFDWPDEVEELAQLPPVGIMRIRPGTTESQTVRVRRPLTTHHPYWAPSERDSPKLPARPEGVVFCLGIVSQPYSSALQVDTSEGVESAAHSGGIYAQQHRFCTDPVPFE